MSNIFKLGLIFLNLFSISVFAATSGIDPSSMTLTVFGVAVSTDPFCTNPVTIFTSTAGKKVDFISAPTLGSGTIANGTYNCVIIEFANDLNPVPKASSDNNGCVAGTGFDKSICRSPDTTQLIDGTTHTCAGTLTEHIAVYLSTKVTTSSGASFIPPTSSVSNGLPLASPLVIAGTQSNTFVVDGTGTVKETGSGPFSCDMGPPAFSFR